MFLNGDDRNTLITRITKIILWNGGEIDIDEDLFNNMPVNSSNPLHIAGDCFRDVLKECGVPDDKADLARKAFICLKLSTFDEMRDRLFRIASQISDNNVGKSFFGDSLSLENDNDSRKQVRFLVDHNKLSLKSRSVALIPHLADHHRSNSLSNQVLEVLNLSCSHE